MFWLNLYQLYLAQSTTVRASKTLQRPSGRFNDLLRRYSDLRAASATFGTLQGPLASLQRPSGRFSDLRVAPTLALHSNPPTPTDPPTNSLTPAHPLTHRLKTNHPPTAMFRSLQRAPGSLYICPTSHRAILAVSLFGCSGSHHPFGPLCVLLCDLWPWQGRWC